MVSWILPRVLIPNWCVKAVWLKILGGAVYCCWALNCDLMLKCSLTCWCFLEWGVKLGRFHRCLHLICGHARWRHSISQGEAAYPPVDDIEESVRMTITEDLTMGIWFCPRDVKLRWGSLYNQDSTAASCHSLTLCPSTLPPLQIKSLDWTPCPSTSQRQTKQRKR